LRPTFFLNERLAAGDRNGRARRVARERVRRQKQFVIVARLFSWALMAISDFNALHSGIASGHIAAVVRNTG